MEFKQLNVTYIEAAIHLAQENYQYEQQQVAALYNKDYREELTTALTEIFQTGSGCLALENGELIGYLAFHKSWDDTENVKETASPIYGYGIRKGYDRAKMISLLFQKASEEMMKEGIGRYHITVYAHDHEALSSYTFNQFGILCTDAIMNIHTEFCKQINDEYEYTELTKDEIRDYESELLALWHDLVAHLQASPTYYLGAEFTDEVYLDHITSRSTRLFVVKDKGRIIGILDGSLDGNNFANHDPATMNVGDLFIEASYRGQNIAQSLLQYASNVLQTEGYERLWVEHGTTNPNALRFWDRYFERFTLTLTRSIDERVIRLHRNSDTKRKIQQLLSDHQISGVFAQFEGSQEIYNLQNGYADRNENRKIYSDTLFGIASGTKFFTALAIGLLINEGLFTLDTPALALLDLGNPLLDSRMTVRHLLNHSSGLPDYLDESIMDDAGLMSMPIPNHQLVSPFDYLPMFPKKPNTNVPGTTFKYNNGAYVYLAMIIEKIGSMSYANYINTKLLKPLGIRFSGVYPVNSLPQNFAIGYYQKDGELFENTQMVPYQAGGDGGIYTNLREMKILWESFFEGKILPKDMVKEFTTPSQTVNSEKGVYYGLGLWLQEEANEKETLYVPYITGSDIGVSFKSSYSPMNKRYIFHVSNTSDGVWHFYHEMEKKSSSQ